MVTPSVVLGVDSPQQWDNSYWDNLPVIEPFYFDPAMAGEFYISFGDDCRVLEYLVINDEIDTAAINEILREQELAWMQDLHVQATLRFHELINGHVPFSRLSEDDRKLILRKLDISEGAFSVASELFLMMERDGFSPAKSVDLMVIMSGGLFSYTEAQTLIANIPNTIERNTEIIRFERLVQGFDIPDIVNVRRLINRPLVFIVDEPETRRTRTFADINSFLTSCSAVLNYSFIEAAEMKELELLEFTPEDLDYMPTEEEYIPEIEYEEVPTIYEYPPEIEELPTDYENYHPGYEDELYINGEAYLDFNQSLLPTDALVLNLAVRPSPVGRGRMGLDNTRRTRPWANRNQNTPEYLATRAAIHTAFTSENAYNVVKQMFLGNRGVAEIEATFAIGAALQVEPETFMLPPGVYRTESAGMFTDDVSGDSVHAASAFNDLEPTPQPPMPPNAVQDAPPAMEYAFDVRRVIQAVDVDAEELDYLIEYGMEILGLGIAPMSAPTTPTHDNIISNPFSLNFNANESVNLNTGAAIFRKNVLSLPGRGGFGLNLDLVYNSADADLRTPSTSICYFIFCWYSQTTFSVPGPNILVECPRCRSLHIGHPWTIGKIIHNTSTMRKNPHGLGIGWRFDLPYIWNNTLYVPGRGAFAIDSNHRIVDYTLQDMRLVHDSTFVSGHRTSHLRLTFHDGISYFFAPTLFHIQYNTNWNIIGM